MKKILTIIGLFLLLPTTVFGAVWQYGSYNERTMMAAECGIFGYQGTAQQNSSPEVIECFKKLSGKSNLLGFSVVTRYRTSLSTSITGNQSTIPVSSMTSFDGTTLNMGLLGSKVFLSLEPGSAREEIVMCTGISGNIWTGCTRGLAFTGTSTSAVSANQKSHNAGSIVVMSNVHYVYDELVDKESGDILTNFLYYNTSTSANLVYATGTALVSKDYVDNRNGYYEAPVANFAALPTGVNQGEMRVTLDDGKVYTWSGSTWILAGAGGGAGTVYRDDIVATSTNRTYSLSSGSWPDKKYLQVFLNGSLLSEGASADYQASTTGNSITLNFDPVVGEVITLRVESIDFYNAEWVNVNTDLLPDVDNTHDIGSSSLQFKDLFLAGNANISGALTVAGMTTLNSLTTTTLTTTTINGLLTLNSSVNNLITVGATSSAGSLQTITHGLGRVPAKFTFNFQGTTDGGYVGSSGVSDTTNNYCVGVGSTGSSGYTPINISESIYSIYYRRYNTYTTGRVTSSNATTFTIEWVQNGASIPFVWTAQ